jgi:hypothetical protein
MLAAHNQAHVNSLVDEAKIHTKEDRYYCSTDRAFATWLKAL